MSLIRTGGVPEHFNLPWQLADSYGLFKKEEIDFKWDFYSSGTGAMAEALAKDELDVAVLLTEGAVSAIINGLDARIIKQYISSPLIWGIHTGNNSGLRNIGDCEGKKYAISRSGSGSHLMAIIDAHGRGKEIEKDDLVTVVNMQGAIPSLDSGKSDVFFWEKYTTKPLVDKGLIRRIGEYITPWSCFQIVASNKALQEKGEKIKSMLEVMNFTCKQFMKASNSIDTVIEKFSMLPEDAYSWFYSTEWNTDFQVSEKMLENVMYSLTQTGSIKSRINSSELVSDLVDLI